MNRSEFMKTCSVLGIGALFPSLVTSCGSEEDFFPQFENNFSGKVLIIGAGAAGITAGYVLSQYGIDFEIIEASSVYGGRVKEASSFADFPIDLGAEWIHTDGSILATLVNNPNVNANIDLINYSPETLSIWKNGKLKKRNVFTNFYGELKFKNTTWYSFFDTYMVPSIRDRIVLNSPVTDIDYSGSEIEVTNSNGQTFTGDRLILTVPLAILKQGSINLTPALPDTKLNALDEVDMPDGIKVFMEFSERFYPEMVFDGGLGEILGGNEGQKLYYDAAFGKDSNRNIFALFAVGEQAVEYATIDTDENLIQHILNELDEMFDGKASQTYVKHLTQNWSKEPFIGGSYTHGDDSVLDTLITPIDNKLYFAGETFAPSDTATAHGAARSAFVAVEEILRKG